MTLFRRILSQRNLIHSANIFVSYFGLLQDLLHCQFLPNKWLERKLGRLARFLSIFGKCISPDWFYCSIFQGNFEITLELCGYQYFQFPVYELGLLTGVFFQCILLKIQNHTNKELQCLQPALQIRESLRGLL